MEHNAEYGPSNFGGYISIVQNVVAGISIGYPGNMMRIFMADLLEFIQLSVQKIVCVNS